MKKAFAIIGFGILILLAGFFFAEDLALRGDVASELSGYKGTIESTAKVEVTSGDFFQKFLPQVIKLSIMVFATVMLVMIVLSGVYLVAGGMDENMIAEAKKMFYYSIVGAVIVTISFAIVYGITQIDWTG